MDPVKAVIMLVMFGIFFGVPFVLFCRLILAAIRRLNRS